jgi:hypothetical protein
VRGGPPAFFYRDSLRKRQQPESNAHLNRAVNYQSVANELSKDDGSTIEIAAAQRAWKITKLELAALYATSQKKQFDSA